ncbi:hypothetical protein D9611_010640 [Ephemerocybe angulata]|uniref:Uncharacterized protein n=1 Tax=Ephemerocybe angulata TaxID=980116 RepID=A0A8H5BV60_9AGAR|nr:hypothetical protein D9611_010640 [Tulosesus angulatus]
MYVPFLSSRSHDSGPNFARRWLERRKGGGGGGRGSTSSSSSGSKSSSGGSSSKSSGFTSGRSSSSSSSSSKSKVSSSSKNKIKYTSSSKSTNTWTKKVGVASVIPAGHMFAGRIAGGGTRDTVYGTRTYGSGYPGVGRGTSGRGLPFFFWPLSWPLAVGAGTGAGLYLHNNNEYGTPSNSSRPGGPMSYAIFPSTSVAPNTPSTFRFLADNTTVALMNLEVKAACGTLIDMTATYLTVPFGDSETAPAPEQAVQYFRASSGVLTLDGYNNSATYAVEGAADSTFPDNTNLGLLSCLNATLGMNLPLIDGATGLQALPSINLVGLVGMLWVILSSA